MKDRSLRDGPVPSSTSSTEGQKSPHDNRTVLSVTLQAFPEEFSHASHAATCDPQQEAES